MVDSEIPIAAEKLSYAAEMLKMLGHPVRLAVVELLARQGEQSVNEIVEALGHPQSTISQHLGRMKVRGLLGSRREATQVVYYISQPQIFNLLECVRNCQF